MLKDQDSPLDLMLRGFDQAAVLAQTGTDIGYHGAGLKTQAKGIDRFAYKVAHVQARVDAMAITASLTAYGACASKTDVLAVLGLSGENTVTLRKLYGALDHAAEFKVADTAQRKASMKSGMLAKYSVDNPFKLAEFQDKAGDTREEKYGARYTLAAGSSLAEGARDSFAQQMKDPDFAADLQARKSAANMASLGVTSPSQSPVVQAKMRATFRERYGVDHPSQTAESRQRQSDLATKDGKRRAKLARVTNLRRYGVESVMQLPERRLATSKSMKASHAVRNAKARKTTRERYGVEYASQRPERRMEMSTFMKENGVEFARRSQETSMTRYGVLSVQQLPDYRAKQSARMLDPDHQTRINAAKKANGSFNTSAPEAELEALLIERFGADDVLTQHHDPRYPYRCDFYIPSRDLFIELNGLWTHGGHWFDVQSEHDRTVVAGWTSRGSNFYGAAIRQWCSSDVAKREMARDSELNYVVFWDSRALSDAALWLALGAPDGRDWEQEYSWLPQRDLSLEGMYPAEISEGPRMATKVARAANWQEFYQRELSLWSSAKHPKWGTVQGHLYSNRLKYLGKLPHELTDLEILRGLSIAGMVRGWTTFDNTGMKAVLAKHEPKSIYDPCAGWGERLVTAAALGVPYLGTDINAAVVQGHARIVEQYGLSEQLTVGGDAALVNQRQGEHTMVFTCPPYGSTELYTEQGAENLGEAEFLLWWAQVVEQSVSPATTVFAYQINQQWKERMNVVLEDAGWTLDEQIAVGQGRASHFNRKVGVNLKREFEEVQVFVR